MKRLKKTLALFTAALFCVLPLFSQSLTAQAEEPITYYLKYLEDMQEWRYQQLTAWDENDHNGPLNHVLAHIKDGDTIIIDGDPYIIMDFNAHLANLTILNTSTIVITTKGVDEYYQHDGLCVLNGDVKNAYIYGNSTCNINNNVTNLNILGENDINANVGVVGTAAHVKGSDNFKVYYEGYNFAKDTVRIENGSLRTDPKNYSITAPTTSKPATTTPSTGSSSASGDYDDVPKTGESNVVIWLTGIAVVCLLGSYKLRRG